MKKFLSFSLIIFLALVATAQPAHYTHNATTGGTSNIFPFSANPAQGKKVQWVITPAGSAGGFSQPSPAPAGNNITTLWFWANSAANANYTNLTIRLATVSTSTFLSTGQYYTGPMTTVHAQNRNLVSPGANNWVSIPLSTPFLYDPTMNLIVEVFHCGFTGTGFTLRQLVFGSAPNFRRAFSDATSACGVTPLPTSGDLAVAGIGISIVPAASLCAQNFDAVTPPALPAGWVATEAADVGGNSNLWETTSAFSSSSPNSAWTNDPNNISDEYLDSRVFPITSPTAQLSFRNRYDLESSFDGMVLEISIGGGPFSDIITAGGSWVAGGYNSTISAAFGSPIGGRDAWSGNSGGFITTTVNLPAAANGQNVVIRWRRATDSSVSQAGVWIDDVTVTGSNCGVGSCVVTCPPNITVNAAPGQCNAVVNYPAPTTNGGCGPVTMSHASGSSFPVGTTTVTASTFAGPSCSFTITVTDNQPPTITCPANMTANNTPGQCAAVVATPAPTNSDNCAVTTRTWALSGATTGSSPATGVNTVPSNQSFNVGVTTVTYTARDAAGNSATCSFTVTVSDTQAPVITCPANITVNNDPGVCGAVVNYPLPTATDNCASQTFNQSSSNAITSGNSVACNAGGLHTDNSYWRAYQLALGGPVTITSVTFGIELANASGTGTTQPVTVRIHTSAGPFPASPRTQVASQTFNIPDQNLTLFTATLTTPVTVPGNSNVVLELFTPSGQTAGHSFFIGSNAAPESGPSYLSAPACGVNNPTTTAAIGFPNMHIVLFMTGLQPVPVTLVSGPAPGATFPVGTTAVTYRATDPSGNSAQCTFNVTVNDSQAPTITCPANITQPSVLGTCTASVNVPAPPASGDNCGIVTRTWTMTGATTGSSPATGINTVGTQTFNVGVTNVTYTVRDAAGNSTSCTFTVTITDVQLPQISVQPQSRNACDKDNVTFSVTAAPLTGTVPLTFQWQIWNGTAWVNIPGATSSSFNVGTVTIMNNHTNYRVLVSSICTTVTSAVALLNVNPLPTVSITPSTPAPVVRPGESITFTAVVSPGGGTVQWSFNGVPIPGATSLVLANRNVNHIGTHTVTYTDLNGCVQTASIELIGETQDRLFVYPSPSSGIFHVRFNNTSGQQVRLNVYDSKGRLVYRQDVTTGAVTYHDMRVNLSTAESGTYIVEVVDAGGSRIGSGHVVIQH